MITKIISVVVGIVLSLFLWILGRPLTFSLPIGVVVTVVLWFVLGKQTKEDTVELCVEEKKGFFSPKAQCGVCGKEVGLNRYKISKSNAWCCADCFTRAGGAMAIDVNQDTIEDIKRILDPQCEENTFVSTNREFRRKCNVCGFVFCFDDNDLRKNRQNANMAVLNSVGAIGSAVAGTRLDMHAQTDRANKYSDKIVDYSRCPRCNSTNIKDLAEEELCLEQANNYGNINAVSSADELKKFKELLDMGVISQEEFETKKKQLLGL